MPKVVDPVARRAAVVEAVFRVVCRDGLENASLRNVAQEAGLAIGSVRHYFDTHSEMLAFAMGALIESVSVRVMAHVDRLLDSEVPVDRKRPIMEALLGEMLPLDEERHREAIVWLAFATAARTRPELAAYAREVYDGMRSSITKVLAEAQRSGRLAAGLDVALEAERLSALLDGMATDAVLQPDRMTPALMSALLKRHLDTLAS